MGRVNIDKMMCDAVDKELNVDFTFVRLAFPIFFFSQFLDLMYFSCPGFLDLICILSVSVFLFIVSVMFNF